MKRVTALAYQAIIIVSLALALALAGVWAQVERNLLRSVPAGFAVHAPTVTLLDVNDHGSNMPLSEADILQLRALPAFRDLVAFAPVKTTVARALTGGGIAAHVALCTPGLTAALDFPGVDGQQLDALASQERSNAVILSRALALQLGLDKADIGRGVVHITGANGPLVLRGILPDRAGSIDGVAIDAWVSSEHHTLLDQLLLRVDADLRPQLRTALPLWYPIASLGTHSLADLQQTLDTQQRQRLTAVTIGTKEFRYRQSDAHWRAYSGVTTQPQAREDARRNLRWLTVLFMAVIAAAVLNFVTYQLAQLSQERARLKVSSVVGATPGQLWRDAIGRTLAPVIISAVLAILISRGLGNLVVRMSPLVPLFPTGLTLDWPFWVSAIGTSVAAMALAGGLAWGTVVRLAAQGEDSRITMNQSQRFAHVCATVAQVAITTAFVAALSAMLCDVYRFRAQPRGFELGQRYWVTVTGELPKGAPPIPDRLRLLSLALDNSDGQHNSISLINGLGPLGAYDATEVSLAGHGNPISARLAFVSRDFFRVSGIPFLQGTSGTGAAQVVISESTAESLNIQTLPQSVHFTIYGIDFDASVLGVARELPDARHVLYVPADDPKSFAIDTDAYLVHASGSPSSIRAALQDRLSTWHQSVQSITPLSDALDDTQRSTLVIVELLQVGAVGLAVLMMAALVASLGFDATIRSRELAVKNLLGATMTQLLLDLGRPFSLPLLVAMLIGGAVLLVSWQYIAIGVNYVSAFDLVAFYLAASLLVGFVFVGVLTLMGRRANAAAYD